MTPAVEKVFFAFFFSIIPSAEEATLRRVGEPLLFRQMFPRLIYCHICDINLAEVKAAEGYEPPATEHSVHTTWRNDELSRAS